MKIFVSGSRSIKTLPQKAVEALNCHMALEREIIVGDCPDGVDSLAQSLLATQNYPRVMVYHVGYRPRCNQGFATIHVRGSRYADKDVAMCEHCDAAIVVWDGTSRGTLANIRRLHDMHKCVTIIRINS